MSNGKFLQIHTLTSYPGTLLNRDDAGFAKRLPFGDATRTRVSSQCLKYHWRNFEGENALYNMDVPASVRSRRTFNQKVVDPLVEDGHPAPFVRAATKALQERLLSGTKLNKSDAKSLLDPGEDEDPHEMIETNQVTILGEPELRYLREKVLDRLEVARQEFGDLLDSDPADWSKDELQDIADVARDFSKSDLKKNLKGLKLASGLDAAMFGRMATSDVLARGDAAIHVAHAITTHAQSSESDYFSAVDELKSETGEMGGGHINSSELTSGLFYGYVVIDVPLLVSNLEGCSRDEWEEADKTLTGEVIERMIKLITTVSPGAKLGSTAPYSRAQTLLVESGTAQPRTLANAFQQSVDEQPDVLENSYRALADYVSGLDQMYGRRNQRQLAGLGPIDQLADAVGVESTSTVPEVAKWSADQVRG
jgi:CRISPR system Cascade subunit CasC